MTTSRPVPTRPACAALAAAATLLAASCATARLPPVALPQDPPPQGAPAADSAQDTRVRQLTPRRRPPTRIPRFQLLAGLGYADVHLNAGRLGSSDSAGGLATHLRLEHLTPAHIGFGMQLDGTFTGDELFEGQTVFDGFTNRPADASFGVSNFHPYFLVDPVHADRFRLLMSVGPYITSAVLDYERAALEYEIGLFGGRVGVRPEVVLADGEKVDLVAFAGASYGLGVASIDENLIGPDNTYDSVTQELRATAGLRLEMRRVLVEFGYRFTDVGINLSDPENGVRLPEFDWHTNSYYVAVGARF